MVLSSRLSAASGWVSTSMSKQWKQETAIVIAIAIVARCLSCLRRLTPEARSAGFGFPEHSVL